MREQTTLLNELNSLVSETPNPATQEIDLLSNTQILQKINEADHHVAPAVKQVLPQIAQAVEHIVAGFKKGGRLIYIGAGTSGRLGVLDAVECPPTFSVSHQQVIGVLAGGEKAMYKAVEGAEDNTQLAINDLTQLKINHNDVVVGIAASGRTPYVVSALTYAKSQGCKTAGITCNPDSPVLNAADVPICAVVGAEVLTGSTRMKSGTAQKLILNMLSTASMIKMGKVYGNLMVDVNASNAKLYARAIRIVMQATQCNEQQAQDALKRSEQNVKLAILLVLTGVSVEQGQALLAQQQGFLRHAVAQANE